MFAITLIALSLGIDSTRRRHADTATNEKGESGNPRLV